jgi:hypothetical protein
MRSIQSLSPLGVLLFLVLLLLPLSCRSGSKNEAKHDALHAAAPCTCGQPEADVQGCAHHQCLKGERNPDNPDCVCGTLTIPK